MKYARSLRCRELLRGRVGHLDVGEHEPAVAEQPEQSREHNADHRGDVERDPVGVVQQVVVEIYEGRLDQRADHVEHHEQHRLTAHVRRLAVPERPVSVAQEGEAGRDRIGQDHRGRRSDVPVERVLDRERDDRAHDTHDAELADLMDQHPKPDIGIADQTQLLTPFKLLPRSSHPGRPAAGRIAMKLNCRIG